MDKKAHPHELIDGRLANYPSGCNPAIRVTAGIQETLEIHPTEENQKGHMIRNETTKKS